MTRLGRISYVNMAPVFYRLEADVEEVSGVPTELSRMLLDGQLDIAPIPSIEYARNAEHLRILPEQMARGRGERQAAGLVHLGLHDARDDPFHRVLHRDHVSPALRRQIQRPAAIAISAPQSANPSTETFPKKSSPSSER